MFELPVTLTFSTLIFIITFCFLLGMILGIRLVQPFIRNNGNMSPKEKMPSKEKIENIIDEDQEFFEQLDRELESSFAQDANK